MILSPEETVKIGGYTYKGGRIIMENFLDQLVEMVNERKTQNEKHDERTVDLFFKNDLILLVSRFPWLRQPNQSIDGCAFLTDHTHSYCDHSKGVFL